MKKKSCRRWCICSFGVILFILSMWQYRQEKKEWNYYKRLYPGKLYTVNDHVMHAYQKGRGKTNIIFISGSGTPTSYTDFSLLQKKLSKKAVTVSYDQPGFGWSESWKQSYDIDNRVNDLAQLLEKLELRGKYTFVAHSLGGLEAIRYAQIYPEKVQGIVFLDSMSPELYAKDGISKYVILNRSCGLIRKLGILRLMSEMNCYLPVGGEDCRYLKLDPDLKKIDLAFYYKNIGSKDSLSEIRNMHKNANKVIEGGKLKDIPIYIIYSDGKKDFGSVDRGLEEWSNLSESKEIEGAKHYLHWSNLDEVYELICKWTF